MSDSKPFDRTTADVVLTALRRTRQVRGFTEELVSDNDLQTILEVARWSGSSRNRQPWNFIVVRERGDLGRLAELAPNAKHVAGLDHYTKEGVGELDGDKLAPLLKLRYKNAISDAVADLGSPEQIRGLFIGFQRYLYEASVGPAAS